MSAPGTFLLVFAALVLATERLVTVLKTAFPAWLEDERKNEAGEVDLVADRPRRLRTQALAFGAALALARCVGVPVADAAGSSALGLPLPLVALAVFGAAAFWSQCVQRCSASKDAAVTRRALEALRFRRRAEELGADPVGSGRAARPAHPAPADRCSRLLLQLHANAPDHLTSPASCDS